MILAFNQNFITSIKSGTKIHTIREDKPNRWRKGNIIHFATGVRTKDYNQFHQGICTGVQRVFMTYAYNDLIQISVNGKELFGYNERLKFAQNDGFETWEEFFNWFFPLIKENPDKEFKGKIIHWTDFKY